MPTIDLPRGPLDYIEDGDPDGVPVVAVHGFMVDRDLWAGTAAALGDRVRFLRPNFPLGAHPVPFPLQPSPEVVVDLLLDFLDALELGDVILLGNDTGGAICQLAVAKRPDRVGRMILTNCDAFDRFPPYPFRVLLPMSRVPGLLETLLRGLDIPFVRHLMLYGPLSMRRRDELWEQFSRPYRTNRLVRRQALGFVRRVRPKDLLAATEALRLWGGETLLVWGQRDRTLRPSLGRRLAAALQAELVEVADSRAFVALDAPEFLAEQIAAFAGSRSSESPAGGEVARRMP